MNRLKKSPRLKGDSWMYYQDWLKKKALSTQILYIQYFIGFLEWLDTDTEGLFKLYLGMIRDNDPRTRKKMGILVVECMNHLMETRGIKWRSSQNVRSAVKGFFKANELPFELNGEKTKHDSVETPNISLDQISKVLGATGSYQIKASIKVGRDSGLRVGDITHLPIRVVRAPLDDPSIEFHTFEWKTKKTGKMANPVLGPDCLESIREWINYRMNTLGLSADDGDPLFCVVKNRKGFTNKLNFDVKKVVRGDNMDESNLSVCFYRLVRKADLEPLPGNTRRPTFHSLRVFHKTALEKAKIAPSWINKMQGRKGEGTGDTYSKPNSDELIEVYSEAYPTLSGIEEGQQEKVDKLAHELGLSQYEITELREEREALRKERDKYRAEYDLRSRLQTIIDNARLNGLPEEFIRKLEEQLESAETFENGVFEFHKLKEEIGLEEERSENWDYEVVNGAADMTEYLNDGWKIFRELKDGSCILRRKCCQHSECQNLEILTELNFAQLGELNATELYPSYIQV